MSTVNMRCCGQPSLRFSLAMVYFFKKIKTPIINKQNYK